MSGNPDAEPRYRWTFGIDENRDARYEGNRASPRLLGDLFAMWVRDRGDLSAWEHAPRLGAIVHAHGDLSLPVIAVWLGIDPAEIRAVDASDFDPPWELVSPSGDALTIDRCVASDGTDDG